MLLSSFVGFFALFNLYFAGFARSQRFLEMEAMGIIQLLLLVYFF